MLMERYSTKMVNLWCDELPVLKFGKTVCWSDRITGQSNKSCEWVEYLP